MRKQKFGEKFLKNHKIENENNYKTCKNLFKSIER